MKETVQGEVKIPESPKELLEALLPHLPQDGPPLPKFLPKWPWKWEEKE